MNGGTGTRQSLHDREHEAAERAHRREHDADQRAINLAVQGIDRRLDELNQLRKEVVTDRSMFLSSETYAAEHNGLKIELRTKVDALGQRIDALEKVMDRAEGAVNTWRFIAGFLGVSGVAALVWAIVNSHP